MGKEDGANRTGRFMTFRVGIGYDVHQLTEDRRLRIGGVDIPHSHGLKGHSDADVLLHAIIDAILGAAALGDIGTHFPDSDARWKGIDSRILLRKANARVSEEGYQIINVDATVALECPKLHPYISEMCQMIAEDLGVTPGQISVKATTSEKLGMVGRKEGVAAWAVCMLTGT